MTKWTIDGEDLQTAGVNSLEFSFTNQAADEATFLITDRGVARKRFVRRQRVVIKRGEEVFFVGWVSEPRVSETPGDSSVEIVLKGPWKFLEEITFGRQVIQRFAPPSVATTTRLYYINGQSLGIVRQAREVLEWAQSASGGAFSVGRIDPGEVPDLPPPDWVESQSCADVFRRVADWAPAAVLWVEYGEVPTFHWTTPGARARHLFAKGEKPLVSANLISDSDMAPDAVVIQYNGQKLEGAGVALTLFSDAFPPSATARTPGAAVFSLDSDDYKGKRWAEQLYKLARQWQWTGEARLQNTQLIVRPGDVVTLEGRAEWKGSAAVVQAVTVSAADDSVGLTMGAPGHLGLDDLRELLWWLKKQAPKSRPDPELNLHSWQVYTEFEALSVPFQKVVKIAPGNVSFGEAATKGRWKGRNLDAAKPTTENLTKDYSRRFFLKVEWLPKVRKFTSYDSLGNPIENYRASTQGTVQKVDVQDGPGTNVAPFVNERSGAAFKGTFFFPIATVEEIEGELRVTQHRERDLNAFFTPPNYLYMIDV
jgi:hypothetical protein